MEQSMICVAADGAVPQKTKKDKLLEPNAEENIKECIVPSPLQVPSSNKSILQHTCTVYCRGFHTENELKSSDIAFTGQGVLLFCVWLCHTQNISFQAQRHI